MGLLDEAIREHLDLKRRRGADPAEVARAEQEALGPVRREPAAAHAEGGPHAEQATALAHDEAAHAHHEEAYDPGARRDGHDDPVPPAHAAAVHDPEPHATAEPDPAPDPRHSDLVHQPTTEFHVEDHHDDEDEDLPAPHAATHGDEGGDEDVLEETPDFLQETPEHDRLWFEQRPPRDFDFDA